MRIGTNDNNPINIKVSNTDIASFGIDNNLAIQDIRNLTATNNSLVSLSNNGTVISSNKANTDSVLTINNINTSSTGDYITYQRNGTPWFRMNYNSGSPVYEITSSLNTVGTYFLLKGQDTYGSVGFLFRTYNAAGTGTTTGNVFAIQNFTTYLLNVDYQGYTSTNRLRLGSPTATPSYLLDVNAGTAATAQTLASFAQNTGSITIGNATSAANNFVLVITGTSANRTDVGLDLVGQGSNSYSTGAISLFARNSAGNGVVTGGNLFQLLNNTTPAFTVDYLGNAGVVGNLNIGTTGTAITTFNASAVAFASLTPMVSILSGVGNGTYKEGIIIRHSSNDATTVVRETGLFIKLSSESSSGEATKGGAITMKSANVFANTPDMNFYILNDATPKMTIYNSGVVSISNLSGTGTRAVVASSTGVLNTVALPTGTVTSVAMTVPTGLSISGSPITTSGTLAVGLQSGYSIPTTANQSNWTTAYGWGNHADAGYMHGESGTYTPTISGDDTYTPSLFYFTRNDRVVHVAGSIQVNGMTSLGVHSLRIELPIPTTVSSVDNITGVVTGSYNPSASGTQRNFIIGYFGSNEAAVTYTTDDSDAILFVQFTYIIG